VTAGLVAALAAAAQFAGQAVAAAPGATTGPAASLTSSSANVTGSVNPNGETTTYSFQFGKTTAYGFQTNPQSAGSGTQSQLVSGTLTGLDPGTTYHYRLIATNASGTTVGTDLTFTTLGTQPPPPASPPPTATTRTAVGIGRTVATVRASINPRGARTTYFFEFGPTPAYGTQTARRNLASGNTARSVSARLTGLSPGQTYHYRVVATNSNGVALGQDRAFSTRAPAASRAVPTLTSRARPRRDRSRPFRFRVSGSLIAPGGVDLSRACRGRVTIRFKLRRRTVGLKRARIRRSCTYRSRLRVRVRPRVRLRVSVRFRGNAVLTPRSAKSRKVRVG
jgi:hypothetical protein